MTLHERVRMMAARLCSAKMMERLIDPALTDVQLEHRDAIARGRPWRSRWIRLAGYLAVLRIIALCVYERTVADWTGPEGRAFARAVGFGGVAFLVTVLLLISPPAVKAFPPTSCRICFLKRFRLRFRWASRWASSADWVARLRPSG
jgi:hypothetical protein